MDVNVSVVNIVIVLVAIIISMTLHEAMHAFTSFWLGDDTAEREGRITLNPIKHIDPILTVALPVFLAVVGGPIFGAAKPVPFRPDRVRWDEFGAALVGLVGPATNFVLAAASAGILNLFGADLGIDAVRVLTIFMFVNIGFFVFNMIPFPPLDGSRVLYAFSPEPLKRVMEQIESFGLMAIAIFIFFLYPFISPAIGEISESIVNFLIW